MGEGANCDICGHFHPLGDHVTIVEALTLAFYEHDRSDPRDRSVGYEAAVREQSVVLAAAVDAFIASARAEGVEEGRRAERADTLAALRKQRLEHIDPTVRNTLATSLGLIVRGRHVGASDTETAEEPSDG